MPRPKGMGIKKFKKKCALTMTTEWYIKNFYKLSPSQKFQASMVIVPKGITEKKELTGSINILPPIIIDGKKFAYNVGSPAN